MTAPSTTATPAPNQYHQVAYDHAEHLRIGHEKAQAAVEAARELHAGTVDECLDGFTADVRESMTRWGAAATCPEAVAHHEEAMVSWARRTRRMLTEREAAFTERVTEAAAAEARWAVAVASLPVRAAS